MRLRRAATEARVLAAAGATSHALQDEPLEDVRDAVQLLPPAQRDAVLSTTWTHFPAMRSPLRSAPRRAPCGSVCIGRVPSYVADWPPRRRRRFRERRDR